ncbi:jg3676 [Pararge aegeria aegeria]|uniref:Jg3676 protein n=1 Tax=Pararge aegeria aegeria TaxID=348720 RepID=A0A8S4QPV8_9NEOP|nr:jg3676 [Pararge aegeria aegeria]
MCVLILGNLKSIGEEKYSDETCLGVLLNAFKVSLNNTSHSSLFRYRECPEGVVHEDSFKDIYAKFFPHGNSALYAHYVFKAFDVNCSGAISFRTTKKWFKKGELNAKAFTISQPSDVREKRVKL